MIYEIILTDSCNRRCPFCYVKQNGYFETDENIWKFISEVKNQQSRADGFYEVNIFGGEPFLNFDGICTIYDAFNKDWRCTLNVVTNGDLVEIPMLSRVPNICLHVSTYDIFNNTKLKKYTDICKNIKNSVCLYTLTESDIRDYWKLKKIYDDNHLRHSIHFSHDPKSWSNIGVDELFSIVYSITSEELNNYNREFSNKSPRAPSFIDQHILRYVGGKLNYPIGGSFCTSQDKRVFYRGKFVGPCMRLAETSLEYKGKRCLGCEFLNMCSKGCFAEIKDDVDEHLCSIEKARFAAIDSFFNRLDIQNIPRMVQYYSDILSNTNFPTFRNSMPH